jgi:hypothetical protein
LTIQHPLIGSNDGGAESEERRVVKGVCCKKGAVILLSVRTGLKRQEFRVCDVTGSVGRQLLVIPGGESWLGGTRTDNKVGWWNFRVWKESVRSNGLDKRLWEGGHLILGEDVLRSDIRGGPEV